MISLKSLILQRQRIHIEKICQIILMTTVTEKNVFVNSPVLSSAHAKKTIKTLYYLIKEIIFLLGKYLVLEISTTKSHMKL